METHDNGLPSLPDDIIREILALLDMEALKSYSLTCRTLSYSAKPFLHRALHVTPRFEGLAEPSDPSRRTELEGLRVLSERGLLQHTRHLSISLGLDPLFIHDLEPYIQQLRTLANLRSLKTRWLDTPSFITKTGEYFGAFLGTLQSLELESPRGDHKQILYFVCQFRDLQDLKINNLQDYSHSVHNGDPNLDTNTSPPFNGTLDLNLVNTGSTSIDSKGGQLILGDLLKLPSGLKFRTLKLSGCVANNLQLLVDACGPTLEELTAPYDGGLFTRGGEHPRFTRFKSQSAPIVPGSVLNVTQDFENSESNWPKAQPQKALPVGYPKPSQLSPRACSPS